jgi:hypothetical protein
MPQTFRVALTICYVFPLSGLSTRVKTCRCGADIDTLPVAQRLVSVKSVHQAPPPICNAGISFHHVQLSLAYFCDLCWSLTSDIPREFGGMYTESSCYKFHERGNQIPVSFILYYETQSSACREQQIHRLHTVPSQFPLYYKWLD